MGLLVTRAIEHDLREGREGGGGREEREEGGGKRGRRGEGREGGGGKEEREEGGGKRGRRGEEERRGRGGEVFGGGRREEVWRSCLAQLFAESSLVVLLAS